MLHPNFVILGVLIGSIGTLSYLIDTLNGKVKPNKISWLLWATAPLIAFFAEIKQGVGIQSLMTFAVGAGPLLIFLASFLNKKAQWKLSKFDLTCGVLSILGLILWYLSQDPNIAIIFSILADGLAAVPTLVKSYREPETENPWAFFFGMISAIITLLTITIWDLAHYGFPLYIFLICLILFITIKFKLGQKLKLLPTGVQPN